MTAHFQRCVRETLVSEDRFYLYRWMHANDYFVRKGDEPTPRRKVLMRICPKPLLTSFCGGSAHFPYSERFEMLDQLALDASSGSPMYWNQIAYDREGMGSRLVVDVDCGRTVAGQEIKVMGRTLWATLKRYYTGFAARPIPIYVARCGPRLKKGKMSTGVHIVAHVRASIEQSQQIIMSYSNALRRALDNPSLVEVDSAIYKAKSRQVSCRMLYCSKIEDCPYCEDHRERRLTCQLCGKDGVMVSRHTYEPYLRLDPATGRPVERTASAGADDWSSIMRHYSIWSEEGDERDDYERPENEPTYEAEVKFRKEPGARSGKRKVVREVKVSNPAFELLHEFFNDFRHDQKDWWAGMDVQSITVTGSGNMAFINVTGTGSQMCPYKGGKHGSNRIYLTLNKRGTLTFQCYCKKSEYACQTAPRITAEVPSAVVQKVFGTTKNVPPSLQHECSLGKGRGKMDWDEFMAEPEATELDDQEKHKKKAKQERLAWLAQFYLS